MEIFTSTITTLAFSSRQSFLVATSLTLLSLLLALLTLRLKSPKSLRPNNNNNTNNNNIPNKPSSAVVKPPCNCCCSCDDVSVGESSETRPATESSSQEYANGGGEAAEMVVAAAAAAAERQTGASMMEQLVPEITTHALSYLDYPSLCRLSMTNSLMRKAANDDSAWKALYHKDFTLEQDTVTPANGWKAYYAATRAVVNVNTEFFNIIRDRLLPAMSHLWLNADYVKCTHSNGEVFSGYNAVIQSWQLAFWEQEVDFQVRDVRARVLTDMAWVTMKTYVDVEIGSFNVTNVFEFHNGRWYMVHHHRSVMLLDGEVDQQMVHA